MTTHLSTAQIESYLARNLSRAELAAVSEHLYGCESCYQQFLEIFGTRREFPIEIDLDELAGLKDWHLEGEDLEAYVEGRMDELDLENANLHLQECPWCREEVENYSEFSDKLKYYLSKRHTPLKQPVGWNKYYSGLLTISGSRLQLASAFALVFLILGSSTILWSVLRTKPREQQTYLAEAFQKEDPPPSPARPETNPKAPASTQANPPIPNSDPGTTPPSLPIRTMARQKNEAVLIARDLEIPHVIEGFDRSPLVVRGTDNQSESFTILSPISTVVSDDRPGFRWNGLSGATSYVVSVYDANLNPIETSQPVKENHWTISKPLHRGMVYTWIVTAVRDGNEVIAPQIPRRAEFKVLEKSELIKLNSWLKHIQSHATRGLLYAKAGLLDEAEQEFQVHLTIHPGDERAKELLRVIKSWREP